MTDPTPEDVAWLAARDRLRAAVGPAALEEGLRRGIGDAMLTDALVKVMEAREMAERANPMTWWPTERNWGDTPG